MIANITSGSSFYGVINYNQKKVDKGEARILHSKGFINTHPHTVATTFNSYNNSRTKKPVFHASLSFSEKDKAQLTDQKLKEITTEYLEKMGYGKQPYLLYRHEDTKHPHVHIVTTRVDIEARKRLPAFREGIKSKAITDQMEIKHNLTISDQENYKLKNDFERDIMKAMKEKKPYNFKMLNKSLKEMELGVRVGNYKTGIFYYKTDLYGKRTSRSSKSSQFKDTPIGYQAIQDKFKEHRKELQYVANRVRKTLSDNERLTTVQFKKALHIHQIEPIFHVGKKGVFGVSYKYKDHTYKASDLDRELSFGKVKDKLDVRMDNELRLKSALTDMFRQGERVKIGNQNGRTVFTSSNSELNLKLNRMDGHDAFELVKLHNSHVRESISNSGSVMDVLAYGSSMDDFFKRKLKMEMDWKRKKGRGIG